MIISSLTKCIEGADPNALKDRRPGAGLAVVAGVDGSCSSPEAVENVWKHRDGGMV